MKPRVIVAAPNLEKKSNAWARLYFAANLIAKASPYSSRYSFSDTNSSSTGQSDTSGTSEYSCTSQSYSHSRNRRNSGVYDAVQDQLNQEKFRQFNQGNSNLNIANFCARVLHNSSKDAPPVIHNSPPVIHNLPPVIHNPPPVIHNPQPVIYNTPQVICNTPQVICNTPQVIQNPQHGRPTYISGMPAQPNAVVDLGYHNVRYRPNNVQMVPHPQIAAYGSPNMASPVVQYYAQPAQNYGPLRPIYEALAITGAEYEKKGKNNFDMYMWADVGVDICKSRDTNAMQKWLGYHSYMFPSTAR